LAKQEKVRPPVNGGTQRFRKPESPRVRRGKRRLPNQSHPLKRKEKQRFSKKIKNQEA